MSIVSKANVGIFLGFNARRPSAVYDSDMECTESSPEKAPIGGMHRRFVSLPQFLWRRIGRYVNADLGMKHRRNHKKCIQPNIAEPTGEIPPLLAANLSGIIETPLLHPSAQPNTQTRNNTRSKPSKPNSTTTIAIALKSGVETFNARVDSQLDSFLDKKGGVHVVLVGDKEAVSTGGHTMVDVYTGEFERAKKRVEESGKSVVIQTGEGMSNRLVNATTLKANTKVRRMEQGHNSNDTSTSGWFDSDGWRADAHKNLPGFRLLFEKFPDADFFMMIDDDTYVFLDNLQRYLSRYDSSQKLYFGQANRFRGCDGVMEYDDSLKAPLVAQGGAGIIMSRGALAAMLKVVDECIVKYNGCWAGDIRVALCLRDADIRLQHLVGLNGWPPQGNFIFSPNPCEVPFTYHH
ncbi:hypothetical protein CcCBS67573_g10173, partial [Chytriomyces confervae]